MNQRHSFWNSSIPLMSVDALVQGDEIELVYVTWDTEVASSNVVDKVAEWIADAEEIAEEQ